MITLIGIALLITVNQEAERTPREVWEHCGTITGSHPASSYRLVCADAREALLADASEEALRLMTLHATRASGETVSPSMPEIQVDWFRRAEQGTPHYDSDRILGCERLWARGESMILLSRSMPESDDRQALVADTHDLARTYVLICGARP